MGFFNKNKFNMKDQLARNISSNLSSCRTCRYFDNNRGVCVNSRESGVTYISAQSPKCRAWKLR